MANPNCERCHGTGLITIQYGGDGYGDKCCGLADADDQPCPSCDDYDYPPEPLRYQGKKWVLLNPDDEHSPRWKRI
jgi:hypothetical protein